MPFIERFNRTFREGVLDAHLLGSLEDVRVITDAWLDTYNTEWPMRALATRRPRVSAEARCPRGIFVMSP